VARYEVAVVGGGLVGAATAYELGLRGVRTLLVDRADAGRATDAGAGILSPATTKRDDPHWVELVQAAGEHYDQLIPRLVGETGWARCGILQLATRESDVPAWEWVADRAPGATEIGADDARAMVPVLDEVVRAESVDDVRVLPADAIVIAGRTPPPRSRLRRSLPRPTPQPALHR
jgi:D-amino-acid dehydrogenase